MNVLPEDTENLPESQLAFAQFLFEIEDHFRYVMEEKLKWTVDSRQITFGHGSVVIKFCYKDNFYIFRVPKYGQFQIKSYRRAQGFFEGLPFFCDNIYYDGKCIIERFAQGKPLGQDDECKDYMALAKVLNRVHAEPAQGYGYLMYANVGRETSAVEFFQERLDQAWLKIAAKQLLNEEDLIRLQAEVWNRLKMIEDQPKVICHGDVWRENVLYDADTDQLTLIDWEGIGAYTKEMDLAFLHRKKVSDAQRQAFFAHYQHEVDPSMIAFHAFLRVVVNFSKQHYSRLTDTAENFLSYLSA